MEPKHIMPDTWRRNLDEVEAERSQLRQRRDRLGNRGAHRHPNVFALWLLQISDDEFACEVRKQRGAFGRRTLACLKRNRLLYRDPRKRIKTLVAKKHTSLPGSVERALDDIVFPEFPLVWHNLPEARPRSY